jgi:hypothetical protein
MVERALLNSKYSLTSDGTMYLRLFQSKVTLDLDANTTRRVEILEDISVGANTYSELLEEQDLRKASGSGLSEGVVIRVLKDLIEQGLVQLSRR